MICRSLRKIEGIIHSKVAVTAWASMAITAAEPPCRDATKWVFTMSVPGTDMRLRASREESSKRAICSA
jgi:hypothetical protein